MGQRRETPQDRVNRQVAQGLRTAGSGFVNALATAGNTGVMGNQRDLPNQGQLIPQDTGLRNATVVEGKYQQQPLKPQISAGEQARLDHEQYMIDTYGPDYNKGGTIDRSGTGGGGTPPATPPVSGENASMTGEIQRPVSAYNNVEQLRKMGLTDTQINAPAVGNSRTAIKAGFEEFTNLGNYGQKGGPNIYGRASKPGQAMDTFVGAGPMSGAAGTNAQGQVVTGGGVYNPTGYNPSDPYGLRSGRVAPARAGSRQFPGTGGLRMSEIRNINAQANRAFNQALESGMNTKAATRIAESIRSGASALTDMDRNDATRYVSDNSLTGTRETNDRALEQTALQQQGANARTQAQLSAAEQEAQMKFNEGIVRGQFFEQNEDGKWVFNEKKYSDAMANSPGGGRSALRGNVADAVADAKTGKMFTAFVNNVNKYMPPGTEITDAVNLLQNARLGEGGGVEIDPNISLVQAILDNNLDVLDAFFSRGTVNVAGEDITVEDFMGLDEGEYAAMPPEAKRSFFEKLKRE